MVIGQVLPDSLSFSCANNNALSESTCNNIQKSSANNKYTSRLQSISPIKLSNSFDAEDSDEDTTNATTIHYSNGGSKSNLMSIFTPNTATTAVESNKSNSIKGGINSQIFKQDMKLKKLRKFTEDNNIAEEENMSNFIQDKIPPVLKEKKSYFQMKCDQRKSNQEYFEEEDGYFEQDVQRFNKMRSIPFDSGEQQRHQQISRQKSIPANMNNQQQHLRFVDDQVYLDEEEDDEFDEDIQNYAFLVEQRERLLYEQEQLKIQQERVNQLSRSTSLRNLQHNMRSSNLQDSPTKHQKVLSRSSSRNTFSSHLPQQSQIPLQQSMGHNTRISNAKSMMNLRSGLNHRKSLSSNPNNIVYEKGELPEELETVYTKPSSNHGYGHPRKQSMPRFKSMSNLRVSSIREENLGVPKKPSSYLRQRVSSNSLYQPQFENEGTIYGDEYDYENEYIDNTFQNDFQSQQIPFFPQQHDKRVVVDYWSLPQELNNSQFNRNMLNRYELQPFRVQPVSKRDQLISFREQQQHQMAMHNANNKKQPKFIPQQAVKYKDGDKSGMMTYSASENRWIGNMDVLEDLDYLPDVSYMKQPMMHIKSMQDHLGRGQSNQRRNISRSISYQNFRDKAPKVSFVDIDVQFSSTALAKWYSYEVDISEKIGHWISTKNDEGDIDDWEIYDLVLGASK
ncbi:hypothetical protein QEN19_003900 [Hanseniaspora menglaensis]